jgi:hypothetical protein
VLEVGVVPATYSLLIAHAFPQIRCTALLSPAVAAIADELIAQQNASARVTALPGDYHTAAFPAPADVILFFGVLYRESEASIRSLLRRANDALEPGGAVYVMDLMTDRSRTWPEFSALFALNMAITTEDGRVFSDDDLRAWLAEAGFIDFSVTPVAPHVPHWLAGARKPLREPE